MGKGFQLPSKSLNKSIIRPEARDRIFEISLFLNHWPEAGEVLAYLLSTIKKSDGSLLLTNLSSMTEPPPVKQDMAMEWFSAVSNLPSSAVVVAVLEFFQLSWTWNQIGPSTGLTFKEFLCLLYRVFQVLAETQGDISLVRSLMQMGFNWPERFGFILERTRIGGGNVIHALEKAQELLPEIQHVSENSLVDFALETGWYLLGDENLPVWRAVGRNGESLLKKLRGFSIQMESIKVLSGFLGRLEETDQLQYLLKDSIPDEIEKIVGSLEETVLSEVLELLSEDSIRALTRLS
ncbi:MAG: hypothetical protein KAQ97_04070, partial [Candidatus Fermentibacteraceae bacterium]|nr:hypothetical protein [Candidatus Fermentibacteraceae bacterium]